MSNRLINEDSPYLQQHANNPVDWYPWCYEAFNKAKEENKPIFLSIGYSSCHWCHVMEHEVFENEEIAEYLNKHFVSIKVDREERPDIDKHFQSVHQLLNQRPGGWPASIFLTPDLKPFFAGTYIPPVRKYNMMGFLELIEVIHKKWSSEPETIVKNADEIQRFLKPKDGPVKATHLDLTIIDKTIDKTKDSYDPVYGGFSKAPKFPHASTINLLLDIYLLTKNDEPLNMVTHTLKNMAKGGIYDLIDGGFCRYSTDDMWLVPHFEKMTYDNGLLCESYLRAYHVTGDPFFLHIAEDIIMFMQNKMMKNNLFFSASDADTEGEEGKYFVYTYDEVFNALEKNGFDESEVKEILKALSITPEGNFEGKNIVRNETLDTFKWWPKVRRILKLIRASKTYPFIDKKVITSWNAMMIKSLFMASEINECYLTNAKESLQTLLNLMFRDNVLYHSVLIDKTPTIEAFLEDYAYLCDALLQAYQTTLDETWLVTAQKIAEQAIDRFYEGGKWYFSKGEFPTEADLSDSSYPSSAAVMTNALLTLGALLDSRYRDIAYKSMEYSSIKIVKYPVWHATFVTSVIRYLKEDVVIKSTLSNLSKLKPVMRNFYYPYILLKTDSNNDYLVCNQHSCFANTSNLNDLLDTLKSMSWK